MRHPDQRPNRKIPWLILHRRNLRRAHLRPGNANLPIGLRAQCLTFAHLIPAARAFAPFFQYP